MVKSEQDYDARRPISKFDIGVVVAIAVTSLAAVIALFFSHM